MLRYQRTVATAKRMERQCPATASSSAVNQSVGRSASRSTHRMRIDVDRLPKDAVGKPPEMLGIRSKKSVVQVQPLISDSGVSETLRATVEVEVLHRKQSDAAEHSMRFLADQVGIFGVRASDAGRLGVS